MQGDEKAEAAEIKAHLLAHKGQDEEACKRYDGFLAWTKSVPWDGRVPKALRERGSFCAKFALDMLQTIVRVMHDHKIYTAFLECGALMSFDYISLLGQFLSFGAQNSVSKLMYKFLVMAYHKDSFKPIIEYAPVLMDCCSSVTSDDQLLTKYALLQIIAITTCFQKNEISIERVEIISQNTCQRLQSVAQETSAPILSKCFKLLHQSSKKVRKNRLRVALCGLPFALSSAEFKDVFLVQQIQDYVAHDGGASKVLSKQLLSCFISIANHVPKGISFLYNVLGHPKILLHTEWEKLKDALLLLGNESERATKKYLLSMIKSPLHQDWNSSGDMKKCVAIFQEHPPSVWSYELAALFCITMNVLFDYAKSMQCDASHLVGFHKKNAEEAAEMAAFFGYHKELSHIDVGIHIEAEVRCARLLFSPQSCQLSLPHLNVARSMLASSAQDWSLVLAKVCLKAASILYTLRSPPSDTVAFLELAIDVTKTSDILFKCFDLQTKLNLYTKRLEDAIESCVLAAYYKILSGVDLSSTLEDFQLIRIQTGKLHSKKVADLTCLTLVAASHSLWSHKEIAQLASLELAYLSNTDAVKKNTLVYLSQKQETNEKCGRADAKECVKKAQQLFFCNTAQANIFLSASVDRDDPFRFSFHVWRVMVAMRLFQDNGIKSIHIKVNEAISFLCDYNFTPKVDVVSSLITPCKLLLDACVLLQSIKPALELFSCLQRYKSKLSLDAWNGLEKYCDVCLCHLGHAAKARPTASVNDIEAWYTRDPTLALHTLNSTGLQQDAVSEARYTFLTAHCLLLQNENILALHESRKALHLIISLFQSSLPSSQISFLRIYYYAHQLFWMVGFLYYTQGSYRRATYYLKKGKEMRDSSCYSEASVHCQALDIKCVNEDDTCDLHIDSWLDAVSVKLELCLKALALAGKTVFNDSKGGRQAMFNFNHELKTNITLIKDDPMMLESLALFNRTLLDTDVASYALCSGTESMSVEKLYALWKRAQESSDSKRISWFGKAYIQLCISCPGLSLDESKMVSVLNKSIGVGVRFDLEALFLDAGKPKASEPCQHIVSQCNYPSVEKLRDKLPGDWVVCTLCLSNNNDSIYVSRVDAHGACFRSAPLDNDVDVLQQFHELMEASRQNMHRGVHLSAREDKVAWKEERTSMDKQLRDLLNELEHSWLSSLIHWIQPKRFNQDDIENLIENLGLSTDAAASQFELHLLFQSYPILNQKEFEHVLGRILKDRAPTVLRSIARQARRGLKQLFVQADAPLILILDKSLHTIPFESMPCLQNSPVCRMPSLDLLLTRFRPYADGLEHLERAVTPGIDATNAYYVLNPSQDLPKTQTVFSSLFAHQSQWAGVMGKAPQDGEYERGLTDHDLFVYCGHSGGEQYVNSEKLKSLRIQAVSVLMGCSSGHLKQHGTFEAEGVCLSYLLGGCPAVIGNLWDVTDVDIDRFGTALLETWLESDDTCSLASVVPQARKACKLKTLIGSSPVYYGLPTRIAR